MNRRIVTLCVTSADRVSASHSNKQERRPWCPGAGAAQGRHPDSAQPRVAVFLRKAIPKVMKVQEKHLAKSAA